MAESVLFEGPELAFRHAARQDQDVAIEVIIEGLGELIDELRQELGSVRAELEMLKADNEPPTGLPEPTTEP